MAIYHAWTGISHHRFYRFPHRRLIAMDPAVGTGSFALPERTSVKASFCIIQKLTAFRTKALMRCMLIKAVNFYHGLNRSFLSFYPLSFARQAECRKSVTVDCVYKFSQFSKVLTVEIQHEAREMGYFRFISFFWQRT